MKVDRSQLFAIITLAALLAISGIGTLCWMWGTQWSDKTGVGVGGIFIALTLLQALFTFSWWKVMQRMPEESQVFMALYNNGFQKMLNMLFVMKRPQKKIVRKTFAYA